MRYVQTNEKIFIIIDANAGINATILHVVISQPGDDRKPAVRPWFGTFFDRRSRQLFFREINYLLRRDAERECSLHLL